MNANILGRNNLQFLENSQHFKFYSAAIIESLIHPIYVYGVPSMYAVSYRYHAT